MLQRNTNREKSCMHWYFFSNMHQVFQIFKRVWAMYWIKCLNLYYFYLQWTQNVNMHFVVSGTFFIMEENSPLPSPAPELQHNLYRFPQRRWPTHITLNKQSQWKTTEKPPHVPWNWCTRFLDSLYLTQRHSYNYSIRMAHMSSLKATGETRYIRLLEKELHK